MTAATAIANGATGAPKGSLSALMLGALGVVYGDIGTSPLYTLKTALDWAGGATPATAIGMLSLIVWTLVITTSIKYVAVVMRADNDGEGGILALMSLLGIKHGERAVVIAHRGARRGAALWRRRHHAGDLGVERARRPQDAGAEDRALRRAAGGRRSWSALFALQPQGTERIGKLFGPVMTVWFVTIGLLGLGGILQHPGRAVGARSALRARAICSATA